jgi:hypothetical protein
MGAWGTAIFSDDVAADVSDRFKDLIAEGHSTVAATKKIIAEYAEELDDADDGIVFWLALAATQFKLGRLTANVRKKAIRIIDSGEDLARWSENTKAEIKQRGKHLAKLKQQLESDPPKPKKVRRPKKVTTGFKKGDVFVYKLTSRTRVRICVWKIWGDLGGSYADIRILGLEDGSPFTSKRLTATDIVGPKYTMIGQEPGDQIERLCGGVLLPEYVAQTFRMPNGEILMGRACRWPDFPDVLRKLLRKLGPLISTERSDT